jgi:hypothetical protein
VKALKYELDLSGCRVSPTVSFSIYLSLLPCAQITGEVFPDRVAMGAYDADIHAMSVCQYPPYIQNSSAYQVLPFFVPFRAMTNIKVLASYFRKNIRGISLFLCR